MLERTESRAWWSQMGKCTFVRWRMMEGVFPWWYHHLSDVFQWLQKTSAELRTDSYCIYLSSALILFSLFFSPLPVVLSVMFPYGSCCSTTFTPTLSGSWASAAAESLEITPTAQAICHHLPVLFCGTESANGCHLRCFSLWQCLFNSCGMIPAALA